MIDTDIREYLVEVTAKAISAKIDKEWAAFQKYAQQNLINAAKEGDKQLPFEFLYLENGTKANTMLRTLGFAVDQRRNPNSGVEVVTVRWF